MCSGCRNTPPGKNRLTALQCYERKRSLVPPMRQTLPFVAPAGLCPSCLVAGVLTGMDESTGRGAPRGLLVLPVWRCTARAMSMWQTQSTTRSGKDIRKMCRWLSSRLALALAFAAASSDSRSRGQSGKVVVVEASTDLVSCLPIWTNIFAGAPNFSDL